METKYFAVFEKMISVDLEGLPDTNFSWEEWNRQLSYMPLTFSEETETTVQYRVSITKETKEFLQAHCNIERNVVGEDTFVLNNLRFKIIEE